jgi:hypothetical protein
MCNMNVQRVTAARLPQSRVPALPLPHNQSTALYLPPFLFFPARNPNKLGLSRVPTTLPELPLL